MNSINQRTQQGAINPWFVVLLCFRSLIDFYTSDRIGLAIFSWDTTYENSTYFVHEYNKNGNHDINFKIALCGVKINE